MAGNASLNTLLQTYSHDLLAFSGTICLNILPPLAVIAIEAPLSLRTWLALQDAQASIALHDTCAHAPQTKTDDSYRISLRSVVRAVRGNALSHVAPTYLLATALLGAYMQCARGVSPRNMQVFDAVAFAPLFIYATSRFFGLCAGITVLSIGRGSGGDPRVVNEHRSRSRAPLACLPLFAGLYVSYRAIMCSDALCTALVHASLLHALISGDAASTKSFRSMVLYSLTNVATILALAVLFVARSSRVYILSGGGGSADADARAAANRWPLFALSVLWNIFPAELVALCYRFDFARAHPTGPLLVDCPAAGGVGPIFLGSADADEPLLSAAAHRSAPSSPSAPMPASPAVYTDTDADTGAPVPARHPPFASKAFFLCALLAHMLPALALLALSAALLPAPARAFAAPLVPLATMPLAVLAVLTLGAVQGRGVLARLWRYEEEWGVRVSSGVRDDENGEHRSVVEGREKDGKGVCTLVDV